MKKSLPWIKHNMQSIDIITVTKNSSDELALTCASIIRIVQENVGLDIGWIIIDGGDDLETPRIVENAWLVLGNRLVHKRQTDSGIYQAMNRGLQIVSRESYIHINSGDVLLPEIVTALRAMQKGFVLCFRSQWHSKTGAILEFSGRNRYCYFFGRMPNHQGMIFPSSFRIWQYREDLEISSDQDLKFRLANKGLLKFSDLVIVSCLEGGVSTLRLSARDVLSRAKESREVFLNNFPRFHAEFLALLYAIRYLSRLQIVLRR